MAPAVSIIVPCYNQRNYIGECLDSILAQSFQNWEIIVVNDGSTDDSASVVEKYVSKHKNKIRLINQENGGVVAARNTGLSAARGQYIFPVDGDDKLAPDCLGELYEAMQKGCGDVIYGDTTRFGAESGKLNLAPPTLQNMLLDNCIPCSALYRKADAEQYGGYDSNMKKGLEDWEFWLNFLSDKKRFYHIPTEVLLYRILPGSRNKSFSKSDYNHLFNYLKQKHSTLFKLLPWARFVNFLYNKKTTQAGRVIIKICKIPIWFKKGTH